MAQPYTVFKRWQPGKVVLESYPPPKALYISAPITGEEKEVVEVSDKIVQNMLNSDKPKYANGQEVAVLVQGATKNQTIVRSQFRKGEWMYVTEQGNWYFEDELKG